MAKQDFLLATHNSELTRTFTAGSLTNRNVTLRPISSPAKLNKIVKKRGDILDVLILDLTLPEEDLNKFIFYIKQYKKDLPVVLLQIEHTATKKDGKALRNLSVYKCVRKPKNKEEAEAIITDLSKILDLDMDKKFLKVEYWEEEAVFACIFKNLKAYFLKTSDITENDGTKVTNCEISDDEYYFIIYLESGKELVIPWDFVLHICEENYPFFKGNKVEGIAAEEIGRRIKKIRKLQHLKQENLAKMTGILRPNIARIEKGKHYPSIDTLERISEALKIPLAKLIAK